MKIWQENNEPIPFIKFSDNATETGFSEITSIANFFKYGEAYGLTKIQVANEVIALITNWTTHDPIEKQQLLDLNDWQPTAVTIGNFIPNGVSSYTAASGNLYTFDPNQDDEILGNIGLERNGIPYDGSNIQFTAFWQMFSSAVNKTIIGELDYAFLSDGEDNYSKIDGTVSFNFNTNDANNREQIEGAFPLISGNPGAKVLQLTLRRKGTLDTYNGDVDFYGVGIIKK